MAWSVLPNCWMRTTSSWFCVSFALWQNQVWFPFQIFWFLREFGAAYHSMNGTVATEVPGMIRGSLVESSLCQSHQTVFSGFSRRILTQGGLSERLLTHVWKVHPWTAMNVSNALYCNRTLSPSTHYVPFQSILVLQGEKMRSLSWRLQTRSRRGMRLNVRPLQLTTSSFYTTWMDASGFFFSHLSPHCVKFGTVEGLKHVSRRCRCCILLRNLYWRKDFLFRV